MPEQRTLLDWTPPQATLAFEPADIRGASLDARISRAVSVALQEAKGSRGTIAKQMSEYLGEAVSTAMLDAYASVARGQHRIPVARLMALIHATGDRRLLELLAEPMGWAVIERRQLPLIRAALLREREDEIRAERKALMRAAGERR